MITSSYDFSGLVKKTNELTNSVKKATHSTVNSIGERGVSINRKNAPVLTGELRDSIDYELITTVTSARLVFFATAEYASIVEFGGLGRPGNYFMYKSAQELQRLLANKLESNLKVATKADATLKGKYAPPKIELGIVK